jgi:hypothetical protein
MHRYLILDVYVKRSASHFTFPTQWIRYTKSFKQSFGNWNSVFHLRWEIQLSEMFHTVSQYMTEYQLSR